jgi:hypothetical protein
VTITATDLLKRTEPDGDCLVWTGWKNDDGYGYVHHQERDQPVHRVLYTLAVGPIPDGHEIDHTCNVRACIAAGHLEPVTHAENQRRLAERQTACRRSGHDWADPRNVRTRPNGRRYCAECDRERQRARGAAA